MCSRPGDYASSQEVSCSGEATLCFGCGTTCDVAVNADFEGIYGGE